MRTISAALRVVAVSRSACAKWLLATLLIAGNLATAHALNIAASKDLCSVAPASCVSQGGGTTPSITPYTPVYYSISVFNNDPVALNVDLQETFQPGFHYVSSTCGPPTPALTGGGGSASFGPLVAQPGLTTCVINGYFEYLPAGANNANNVVTIYASADTLHQTPLAVSNVINATVTGAAPIPADVSVAKTAVVVSTNTVTGAVAVHYKITITNNGPGDVFGFVLQDRLSLPATSVPLSVTFGGGSCGILPAAGTSTCFGAVPTIVNSPVTLFTTTPADFLQWSYPAGPPGVLKQSESMVIEFDATIAPLPNLHCIKDPVGNAVINEAHVGFNLPGAATTIQDANPVNNTATATVPITIAAVIDPLCGTALIKVEKTQETPQPLEGFAWNSTIDYSIRVTNLSPTQTIGNIQLIKSDGSLGDLVRAGVGTPPFTATLQATACLPSPCSGNQPPIGTSQHLTGYGDTKWMFGTVLYAPPNVTNLAPGASVGFKLTLRYSEPGCDAYPDVKLKPVINFVRASYQDPGLGTVVVESLPVTAYMKPIAGCLLSVKKSASPGTTKVSFGPPSALSYTVSFTNNGEQPITIGTLIDTLRITQSAYATQLPVDYSYTCSPSPAGAVTGYPALGTGTVTAIFTSLPQQGVRIIQNAGPVTFQPQATLTCAVTVVVHRPAPGDPNCARVGALENTAIMDPSAFFNSNLPWPPGTNPGNAAKVSLPLPPCLNIVVNKKVDPIWTTQNGGPLNYTLTVTNLAGAPITSADGLTLTDTFTPSKAASTWNTSCIPFTAGCVPVWSNNPTINPSILHVNSLQQNQAVVTTLSVPGPYPAPPGTLCNRASALIISMPTADWYPKDPATWQTILCAPIFDARPLQVTKTVTITAPATAPPATPFTVSVNCSYILNGVQYAPSTTLTFSYPPSPAPVSVPNIPVGSTCLVIEQPPPLPVATAACPSGTGAWGPVTYPNPVGPNGTGQSINIVSSATNKLEVHNVFACTTVGTLNVSKTFDPVSPASQFPAPAVFPVTVACIGRPPVTLNLASPTFQQQLPNIPTGSLCTITELAPTGVTVTSNCHWETTYPLGNSVTIGTATINLQVRNALRCTGTLAVSKTFDPGWLPTQLPAAAQFPIKIACVPGATTTVNLGISNGYQFQLPGLAAGAICTITELPPLNAAPPGNCQWTTTYPKGQSATIINGTVSLVAQNSLDCPCVAPPTGMIAWWKLDETAGVSITDIIGGHDGTAQPGPVGPFAQANGPNPGSALSFVIPPAMVGGSLYFWSQATRFISVPNSATLNFGSGDFSIDAWVYPVVIGASLVQPIVDKMALASGPAGALGYRVFILNGRVHFVLVDGAVTIDAQAPIPSQQWHHVTVVREGNVAKIYIDGVLASTTPSVVGSVTNSANLRIGGMVATPGVAGLPVGFSYGEMAIDELEIFDRALLPSEIKSIVDAWFGGKCKPRSPVPGGDDHTVIEFYNAALDNFFVTANPQEQIAVSKGAAGPGWTMTGDLFNTGGSAQVCRFYGSLFPGPNSHFYTISPAECQSLKDLQAKTPATQKRWNFESNDFMSSIPVAGRCGPGTVAVYRAYNDGFARGIDSNHRITTNQAAYKAQLARGWTGEGVVMCAAQ